MKVRDLLEKLEYEVKQGNLDEEVTDVIYDSRKAKPGTVFVCIKGTKSDSHDYIPAVLNAGVKVLVTEHEVEVPEDVTLAVTGNGREALAKMSAALFGYPAEKMMMIGITGTKGKTTTAHMMRAILESCGKKTGMIGTNGVTIGTEHYPTVNTTPESYTLHQYFSQMVNAGCECCVMEVSSQAFKMHRVTGIMYDYAIFTNISRDHIGPDEHDNFEEYLYCKKQLFKQCREALINHDDEHFEEIIEGIPCKWHGFSLDRQSDFQAEDIHYVSEPDFVGLEFTIKGKLDSRVRVNIPGRFNVYNALAAAAAAKLMELSPERVAHALEHLKIDGRMEIVYTCEKFCVIVDYAHNAVSLESLLTTLREYNPKRLVCVFGCGGNRSKDRRYTMGDISGRLADLTIITADNSRFEKVEDIIADIRGSVEKTGGAFLEIPDRREAIAYSIIHAEQGDMIAIAGKGHEDYQEIEGVRHPFLDRAVVQDVIKEL